jgi:hypothetical protein
MTSPVAALVNRAEKSVIGCPFGCSLHCRLV